MSGPVPGWNAQNTSIVSYGTATVLPGVDVQQDWVFWIEARLTIVASGDAAAGFNQGSTSSNKVVTARGTGFVHSGSLRDQPVNTNTDPDQDNGLFAVSLPVYSGASILGTADVLMGRNTQNQPLVREHWGPGTGAQAIEIGLTLLIVAAPVAAAA